MFSFLEGRQRGKAEDKTKDRECSPYAGSLEPSRNRVPEQTVDDDYIDEEEDDYSPRYQGNSVRSYFNQDHEDDEIEGEGDVVEDEDEDEDVQDTPLLPIFSAAHLDRLPLYNITHSIRLIVIAKCETTLSWDQLRSPQISQFLVKPIQSQLRMNHFNRATLCALIANCLQFHKECQTNPGTVGVSRTRAWICELLAMRLVKEYTTRELIDALSYDFDPLQGMSAPTTGRNTPGNVTPAVRDLQSQRVQASGARVSTIEIAIRAQAKRFLAHPLIVQHLEAIWAGTVVFHSVADNLHRKPPSKQSQSRRRGGYGTIIQHSPSAPPADSVLSRKAHGTRTSKKPYDKPFARRSVTLYCPRDASLFKLSRLRVPRYRQVFSTLSFAMMLGLFLAVLVERSLVITPLEVVFWLWSAGYMLDEVVGFTEQGFGLYILSFWNAFDLGILLLVVVYYCLRLYGIVLAEQGKHRIAGMAYDVLASTAVLLFPRLFSVLDHYRYFSQLLIAFRMMAQDLSATLVLIVISCSGFFVAFTLSFSDENTDGSGVAYALFQILMGFTPAAWDKWPGYNALGKAIMAMFLIICHFLIVTILITVLTNSFMAIVKNAEEEHQFLFAVNTISMVKSDALFSYIAPTNVIGWVLSPLRYIIPFRQYVKLNRTIIKATHFPVLFVIFAYERTILPGYSYEPTALLEKPVVSQRKPLAFSFNQAPEVCSPGRRLREPSVISFQKDRALDEVFRRPYRGSTVRTTTREMDVERRNSTNAVNKWMRVADDEGGASPPQEQPRSVLERLETRRPHYRRAQTGDFIRNKRSREFSTAMSAASDPELLPATSARRPHRIDEEPESMETSTETLPRETDADADADDENVVESDHATPNVGESAISIAEQENRRPGADSDGDEYFQTPTAGKSPLMQLSRNRLEDSPDLLQAGGTPYQARAHAQRKPHSRNVSSGTILFAPQADGSSASHPHRPSRPGTGRHTNSGGNATPPAAQALTQGQRTPRTRPVQRPQARLIMPPRQKTAPSPAAAGLGMSFLDIAQRDHRQPSFNARALDLASEIGDNKWGPSGGYDAGSISGMAASFSEQLLRQRELERMREEKRRQSEEGEKVMMNRMMLARMHTLEEGFREVLKEIKDLSHSQHANSSRRESEAEVALSKQRRERPFVDTASGSIGQSAMPPRTPEGEAGGDGKHKKSPRKLQRRGMEGKEFERSGSALQTEVKEAKADSPNSVQSVIEVPQQLSPAEKGDLAERPRTAVWTPRPQSRQEDEDR